MCVCAVYLSKLEGSGIRASMEVKISIYRLQYQQRLTVLIQKELTDIALVSFSKMLMIKLLHQSEVTLLSI